MNRTNGRPGNFRPGFQTDPADFPVLGSGHPRPPPGRPGLEPSLLSPSPMNSVIGTAAKNNGLNGTVTPPPGLAGSDPRTQLPAVLHGNVSNTPGLINLAPTNGHTRPNIQQQAPHRASPPLYPRTNPNQVLTSPADQWGLLGLLNVIRQGRECDLGYDITDLNIDITSPRPLYTQWISPFYSSTLEDPYAEPSFDIPKIYPSDQKLLKVEALTEESLFVMFYGAPKDALQEYAADHLYQKHWRFYKKTGQWLMRVNGAPTVKVPGGETGTFVLYPVPKVPDNDKEPERWIKETRQMTVMYEDLETRIPRGGEAYNALEDSIVKEQRWKEQNYHRQQQAAQTAHASYSHVQGGERVVI